MADAEVSQTLRVLRRQYLQLVEPHQLRWPDSAPLKAPHTQAWIYAEMFDVERIMYPPPEPYQLRVLKLLVSKLEQAIEDPEEDVRYPSHHQAVSK